MKRKSAERNGSFHSRKRLKKTKQKVMLFSLRERKTHFSSSLRRQSIYHNFDRILA